MDTTNNTEKPYNPREHIIKDGIRNEWKDKV